MGIVKLLFLLAAITTTCQGAMPFKTQCLYWHNYYRRLHQVGPVTWSDKLQVEAEQWAKYLADNNKFEHSKKNPGNLYMAPYRPAEYCTDAIWWFHNEEKFYDFDNPGYKLKAGHFTQVVWKHSKQIGAAWAIRKDNKLVVVIKYNPGGNYIGFFDTNVFPPITPTYGPEVTTAPTAKKPGARAAGGRTQSFFVLVIGVVILALLI